MRSLTIPGAAELPGEGGARAGAEGLADPQSLRRCHPLTPQEMGQESGRGSELAAVSRRGAAESARAGQAGAEQGSGSRVGTRAAPAPSLSRSDFAPRQGWATGIPPSRRPCLLSPAPPLAVRLAAPTSSAASFPALRFFCSDSLWLRGPVYCPVNK